MTIGKAINKYSDIEADLLLGHILKKSKEFLYMNSTQVLTNKQLAQFNLLCKKRLQGTPIAYLLGYKYFYGLKFKVNRNVLIPRPESEWLVDKAIQLITNRIQLKPRTTIKVLDIGTGSGCIAISIASALKSKKVIITASDISERALKVAEFNAKLNNVNVRFFQNNLLDGIKEKFDLIIANLPYVPIDDYNRFYENLKFEPKLALTDNTNTSVLIHKLLGQYQSRLKADGVMLLEFDSSTAKQIKSKHVKIVKDYNKLDRYAIVKNS
jgi:release factor glutamine methyltransferase